MADKISTIILGVDLDCHQCYKKIRKILCKIQDQERISTISYDDRSSKITIVGPFDPHKLSCKIRCKGGKVVKDIQIMGDGKPAQMSVPPPVNNGKQKPKQKSKPKEEEKPPAVDEQLPPAPAEKPPASPQPVPPERERSAAMPAIVEEKKPKEGPAELELEPPKETPVDILPLAPAKKEKPRERPPPPPAGKPIQPADVTPMVEMPSCPAPPLEIPSLPGLPVGPVGPCGCPCCAPCYQGYYEGCRCCYCGRAYGYAAPPAAGCCRGAGTPYLGGYMDCQLFSDENPAAACIVM